MPSRASSETNSRADSSLSRSASRSNPSSTAAVVSAFDAARPCGEPRLTSATSFGHRGVHVVGCHRDQSDLRGFAGVERLAGQVVAGGGPRRHLRQQRQRDDRRGDTDAGLGQREGAARTGDRDIAGADQTEAAGPDMPVDGGDHRQRRLDDGAQQRGHFPGPSRGHVERVAPAGLAQVRPGAEGAAGVPEHHHPHRRIRGGVTQPLMQLGDQRGRQRVAVMRRVQRQPGERAAASAGPAYSTSVSISRTGAGPAMSARRSSAPSRG